MPITFQNADIKFSLQQKAALKQFIAARAQRAGYSNVRLGYIFCSDEYLLQINRQFLKHNYYTDIITFDYSSTASAPHVLEGEIYISIHRVRDNAMKFASAKGKDKQQNFITELHRVMFHGVLHLLGNTDKTKAQKEAMRKLEDKWLREYRKFSQVIDK